jgi:hypothetical protein
MLKTKSIAFLGLVFLLTFASCTKTISTTTNSRTGSGGGGNPTYRPCSEFVGLKIKPVKSLICGEKLLISADTFDGARFDWTRPDGREDKDQEEIYVTDKANIYHRGWYKLWIGYNTCKAIIDSIYVDVKLPQGTPSCSPANNSASYSNGISIPTKNFNTIVSNGNVIEGYNGLGDFKLTFHGYWKSVKLEPGIYYTTHYSGIGEKDGMDKIYIEDRYANERWYGEENKPVYVSYVGGKLTITLCNIPIRATTSNGSALNSTVSAKLTLP